jgi:flagellar capping protein FliD
MSFLDNHNLNFDQVQIIFLNEINRQYMLSNAEAVGVPSNNSKNVVIFCQNLSLDLNNLKIIKNSNETIDFIEGMSINQNNLTSLSIKIFNQSFEINI